MNSLPDSLRDKLKAGAEQMRAGMSGEDQEKNVEQFFVSGGESLLSKV